MPKIRRKRKLSGDGPRPKKKAKQVLKPACRGRKHFYTYPRCPLEPSVLLDHIKAFEYVILNWVVCRELHADEEEAKVETPYHLHGYIEFDKTHSIIYEKLALTGPDGTKYIGHYETAVNGNAVALYCTKDGEYDSSFKDAELGAMAAAALPKPTTGEIVVMAVKGDLIDAFEAAKRSMSREMILHGPLRIKSNLAALDETRLSAEETTFEFTEPASYKRWNRKRQSLVLIGLTDTGKSNFARRHAFKTPCVVSGDTLDGLKLFNPDKHDGLVFDDMDFADYPKVKQLRLTLVTEATSVNVKMTDVVIPAGTHRIFVMNKFPFSTPLTAEMERRLHVVTVKEDMRVLSAEQRKEYEKPEDDLAECLRLFGRGEAQPFSYVGDK